MIEVIKKQLTQVYDGDPWYGPSVKTVLESVDPARVYDSPDKGVHSIAELTAHIISWRTFAERRLSGDTGYLPEQEQTFGWSRFSADREQAWTAMSARLKTNQHQLLTLLDQYDDSLLERKVAGKPYSFHYLLTGLIQHDVYHLGQIVYIQKLLGQEKQMSPTAGLFKYSYKIFPFENLALQK